MSEVVFEINDLVKIFGSLRAVNGASTVINKGEAVFIVGPSGSGKSTFLRKSKGVPSTEGCMPLGISSSSTSVTVSAAIVTL